MEMHDVISGIIFVAGIVATFLGTKHSLKEYTRDKIDELRKEIHNLNLTVKDLQSKDELQQQVIDQIEKQAQTLIPNLLEAIKQKQHA